MKLATVIIWILVIWIWADVVFGQNTKLIVPSSPPGVVISWPAQTNGAYVITTATNVLGPWTTTALVPFPAGSFTNPANYPAQFFRAYTVLQNTNGTWTVSALALLTNAPPVGYTWELTTN